MKTSISRRAALAGAMVTIPAAALPAMSSSTAATNSIAALAARYLAADDICRALSEPPRLGVAVEADLAAIPGYGEAAAARQDSLRAITEKPAQSLADLQAKAKVLMRELDQRRGGGLDPFASEAETLAWWMCNDLSRLG